MKKSAALLMAVTSVAFMTATAVSISYNGWLVALFGILTLANIGLGFSLKARGDRSSRD